MKELIFVFDQLSGLGHRFRCDTLADKCRQIGLKAMTEPYRHYLEFEPDEVPVYDTPFTVPLGRADNSGGHMHEHLQEYINIGYIDLVPSALNNYNPSIDYCAIPDIPLNQLEINSVFTYPYKEIDGLKNTGSPDGQDHKKTIELLSVSEFAVVKAGTIAYEAIACGVSTYVYGTTKWEWARACELVDKGYAKFYKGQQLEYFNAPRLKDGSYKIINRILRLM